MKYAPLIAIALVSLPAMLAQSPKDGSAKAPVAKEKQATRDHKPVIRPTIPLADRHEPGKVFVEYADRLEKAARLRGSDTYRQCVVSQGGYVHVLRLGTIL